MRENRCSYLRVFLLSNIRVQSRCCKWPTQQRISLATMPHSLREISWLKPQKILSAAPQHKTTLQPHRLPNLDCVSASLSHTSPALAPLCLTLALHQPFVAYVNPKRPCVSLLRCCAALPAQSLPSLFLCTQCPSATFSITDSISLSKPCSRE